MNFRIFVSYRQDESAGHAERLTEQLRGYYDEETVFLDKSSIPPGAPFPERLKTAVTESEVMLAVIGKKWLSCEVEKKPGKRRLDDSKDWVREELRRALRRDGRSRLVIPVLVEGASMPKRSELPNVLKELANCQAISFDHRWNETYRELVSHIDRQLHIPPEERAEDWIFDDIAKHFEELNEPQRLKVAEKLSALDGGGAASAFSARALAKRFYRIGPAALECVRQTLRFDRSLRDVLERLKDYWVTTKAATELAETWVNDDPARAVIVQGHEPAFTPACIVQKASKEVTPWRVIPISSTTSQPSHAAIISYIHGWLRTVFADAMKWKHLPDSEEERVTAFLNKRLEKKASKGQPLAVQLDEIGATDEPLIRSILTVFPHLRLLILVPDEHGVTDMERRYFKDVERRSTTVIHPEAKPGDEQEAADAYYEIADDFRRHDDII